MKKNSSLGFTFLELLVVMIIILILATFAYPVFISVQERANITRDMNNLRQLGIATQRYLSDSDGVLFSTASGAPTWMRQLHPVATGGTQYLADWGVFQAPWDTRTRGATDATTPVSYGFNGRSGVLGLDTSKISNPVAFVFFGSAQDSDPNVVKFDGLAASGGNGVTVYGNTSTPGGSYGGTDNHGTHQRRLRICAVCADGHAESMTWKMFINEISNAADPGGSYRWTPYTPFP